MSDIPQNGFFGPDLLPDTPLYRIYPQKYLQTLLEGKFVIRSTRAWTDPYEHIVSRSCYAIINNGKYEQHFVERNIKPTFGQCWSRTRDSDAMWRIYSTVHQDAQKLDAMFDAGESVRLRTTAKKLLDALASAQGSDKKSSCFIARVRYFEENDLTQEIANIIGTYRENAFSGAKGNADAQLFKRAAFEHESEVRLIYVDIAEEYVSDGQIEISVDPNQLIEEITLDPRIRAGQQETWRTNWLREHGFQNDINRSLLYLGAMLIVPLYTQEDLAKITKPPSQ